MSVDLPPSAHPLGFSGKTVYVYGLGKSGQAAVNALLEDGAYILAWDDRESNLNSDFNGAGRIGRVSPHDVDWDSVAAVMKSPGIPSDRLVFKAAKKAGVPIIGDIDLLYRRNPEASFIGITGTNGKSTTTALVAHVLRSAGVEAVAGGNLGQAALSLPVLDEGGVYVLELSSYQLEMVERIQLDASVILNLTPDHLDRHGTMEAYLEAKARIFSQTKPTAPRVITVDTPQLQHFASSQPETGLKTLTQQGNTAEYRVTQDGKLMHHGRQVADLTYFDNLPGPHNWQNIVAAKLLCAPWVDGDAFFKHLRTFRALPHRMEKILDIHGVKFINDSKATNAESAVAALQSFSNIYWIAGGKPKAEGVTPCLDHLSNVLAAFLIGDAEDDFEAELDAYIPCFKCGTLEEAVRQAFDTARQEGQDDPVVLLSPACASFDQFFSFEQRGDAFAMYAQQTTQAFQMESVQMVSVHAVKMA